MPRASIWNALAAGAWLLTIGSTAIAEELPPRPPALAIPTATESPSATGALADQNRRLVDGMKAFERQMQELRTQLAALQAAQRASAPDPAKPGDPFAWGDFSWINGGSRQTGRLLDSKYFTPQIDIDVNYTYSLANPVDDTVVGSTALARNNEMQLAFLGAGGDFHMGNVRGRLMLQYGTRSTIVPRNDGSLLRGQFDLATAYRYISEGYAGYHFDWMHGVNVDLGIFMSYIGLFSYDNFENWAYQPSYTSDNTPWFFNGARIQMFPTDRLKVELWLINGWQTYAKFNSLPGAGFSLVYSPRESVKLVTNNYVGTDTQDHPGRVRFHSDSSALFRYFNRPSGNGLSRAALSATVDVGFEQGDGVAAFSGDGTVGNCTADHPCEQDFVSAMAYNRLWFWNNQIGWTVGGGFIHNPGRYLVLVPTGAATATGAAGGFDTSPGTRFDGWDVSTTLDWMPTENLTFRVEGVHREASVPYFAGHGGVTAPDGYKCGGLASPDGAITSCAPTGWTPDLVKDETRFILAVLFRI